MTTPSAAAHPATATSGYLATESLRDGRRLTIRALRPEDRVAMLAAVERTGEESRYRRFFTAKRAFSEAEIAFYTNVDFDRHVALVAELEEAGQPVIAGGSRYIVSAPGEAEVAFMVGDRYQGLGIGSRLMRHLAALARRARLKTLVAEVLPGNDAMLRVFERSRLAVRKRREGGVLHLNMDLGSEGSES